ncbi:Hsp70 family protein [Actinoplanes bogorensis]|uniref:Hsp70 family protein n=1 Tax=Paractinoplanes bogorensis TaxID=1610840 RepID=A0ABS5YUN7_9ACTN|nr:Hsp70 family protein [Actinoplanes bogorensis]MBU2667166.1 Hsp70 family protein [Actinoplanes bogorensis]
MADMILVFDLGTDTAAMALVADGEVRFLAEPGSGLLSWSSAVCLDGRNIVVGTAAENRRQSRPAGYRAEIKRDLGRGPVRLGDRDIDPFELVVAVLRQARTAAERDAGVPVEHVLLSVPASYGPGDPRWDLMIAAGEAAGFTVVELIAEPVAAALAPVAGPPFPPGSLILVYDLGGGTFDTALVRVGETTPLRVASADGCAGRDLDAAIFAELADELGVSTTGETPLDLLRRTQLADLVRLLKHDLSERDETSFVFAGTGAEVTYDRARLDAHALPLLKKTLDTCDRVLAAAGVEPGAVDGVLLSGGVTRMPIVASFVAEALGRPLRHARDPQYAVVAGAAQRAANRTGRVVNAEPPDRDATPMRWNLPGGTGTLLAWDVAEGGGFRSGDVLAQVRGHDGAIWDLAASQDGVVVGRHVDLGGVVHSGDWLVTSARKIAGRVAGQVRFRLLAAFENVNALAVSAGITPNGRLIAVHWVGKEIQATDPYSGERILAVPSGYYHTEAALDPDAAQLVTVETSSDIYKTEYHVFAYDLTSGKNIGSLSRQRLKRWACLGGDRVLIEDDGTKGGGPCIINLRTSGVVGAFGFTEDEFHHFGAGGRIVMGTKNGWGARLLTYDAAGVPVGSKAVGQLPFDGRNHELGALAATSDRAFIVMQQNPGMVSLLRTPEDGQVMGPPLAHLGHVPGSSNWAAFSPDDQQLVVAGGNWVTHWELEWPS